jgi:hypothetical protein
MIHSRLTTWLWWHFHNYVLQIMHSLSIVDFWNKKYGLIIDWTIKKIQEFIPNCL